MAISTIALALLWCVLTRDMGLANVLAGLLLGWLAACFVAPPGVPLRRIVSRAPATLALASFFVWEMLVSNLRMARLVLAPRSHLRPAILAVPVEVESDAELALLSNLVTLTPGTLGLDVSEDRQTLFVHVLTADDFDAVRQDIRHGLARRVRRVFAC